VRVSDRAFLCFSLFGLYALDYENRGLPKAHQCLLASFCFSAAALAKPSQGVAWTLFILFNMGHKVLQKANHFCKLVKFLGVAAWSLALILSSYFFAAQWMPYKVLCVPHRHNSNVMADFCTESWPTF